jgi:hypothetical protein
MISHVMLGLLLRAYQSKGFDNCATLFFKCALMADCISHTVLINKHLSHVLVNNVSNNTLVFVKESPLAHQVSRIGYHSSPCSLHEIDCMKLIILYKRYINDNNKIEVNTSQYIHRHTMDVITFRTLARSDVANNQLGMLYAHTRTLVTRISPVWKSLAQQSVRN